MNPKKIAFLLDFDGPFFNTELVEVEIKKYFGISDTQWQEAYKEASIGNTFVNIGFLVDQLAKEKQKDSTLFWDKLSKTMKKERFCSQESREVLIQLARIGHVELVTQGDRDFQQRKLDSSGVEQILVKANEQIVDGKIPHTVKIITEDKATHLSARVKGLIEDGYTVIQIDDRVDPLMKVKAFAESQGIAEQLFQIRIPVGKYARVPNPRDSIWRDCISMKDAARYINLNLLPALNKEGHTRAIMNR